MADTYLHYYKVQSGAGLSDIGPVYYNHRIIQQGRGIGSFFAALYRYFKPVFVSGLSALKNQALKTGSSILEELGSRPLQEIITTHGKRAVNELGIKLKNKFQDGSGLFSYHSLGKKHKKDPKAIKGTQSLRAVNKKSKTVKKKKKAVKKRILDIFTKKK